MTLAPGSQIGPYEVIALLGAGGMGEVYRARHTRLNRHAICIEFPFPDHKERYEASHAVADSRLCRVRVFGCAGSNDSRVIHVRAGVCVLRQRWP